MPHYKYKAMNQKGKVIRGDLTCANLHEFHNSVNDLGLFCIDVKEPEHESDFLKSTKTILKQKHLSLFCKQFSSMLSSGLQISQIINILQEQSQNGVVKDILVQLYQSNQKGMDLSEAMRSIPNAFPTFMENMVEAGEKSGSLDVVMEKLSEHYEKEIKLNGKITQALMYPMVLSFVTVTIVILIFTLVIPRLLGMFGGDLSTMPFATRLMMQLSSLFVNYWPMLLFLVVAVVIGGTFALRYKPFRFQYDRLKLSLPVIGALNSTVLAAKFARTLSMLFSSGLPIVQSIELTGSTLSNIYVTEMLNGVIGDISKGELLSVSLDKLGVFPHLLITMFTVGEESGSLDEMLLKTAEYYDTESDSAMQKLVSLTEPVMIIILGVIVAIIIISVMQPIYGLYNNMGK